MSVIDKIRHYQRSIYKSKEDEERTLYCIKKLHSLPVTVQHLQETGVGRTVNILRKYDGSIGNAAKALVAKWKKMVADEETTDEEDEACVPDVPESYSDYSPESPVHMQDLPEAPKSQTEDSPEKHCHKAGTSGSSNTDPNSQSLNKQESTKSSNTKTPKDESQRQSRGCSKSESREERKSSSKDSKSSKSTSKKDEECTLKDKDHSKSGSSRKSSDKVTASSKSSVGVQNDKEDPKKRKLEDPVHDRNRGKKRKSFHESDDDMGQPSSDSERDSIKTSNADAEFKSPKEISEVRVKQETTNNSPKNERFSNKDESRSEKRSMHEKSRSNPSKSKADTSSTKAKESEDKHKHKHKHKSNEKEDKKKTEKKRESTHRHEKESSKSKNHHSSSSSKHDTESKDKSKKKDGEKEKRKDDVDTKSSKKESKRIKQEINGDEGIDCNSGASFAEALGMCTMMPSKKRNTNSPVLCATKVKTEPNTSLSSSNKKSQPVKTEPTESESSHSLPLLAPNVKLEPLNVDLASTLPEISPNYKPLPYINHIQRRQEDKALTDVIYTKNQRTKVYSGNKSGYTSVPTLYEMCIRILIENIDALEFTGGVPYDILKPVLERATPDQLFMLEHYNPYLIEDTDSLWQFHCKREFRNKEREEMESWREMYMRCLDEREAKLKTLTANIKQSIDKSLPVRSTKLAYVDNVVKPPRNVLKKQAKYGTASSTSASDLKKKLIAGGGVSAATNISVPPPPMPRMRTSTSGVVKKTKAPLMAKALQLIKGRYKR